MSDPLEQQTVADFILESEVNLKAAVHMAKAFPQVRRQIVVAVLDDLEKKLRETLGAEWEIYNNRDDIFQEPYTGFAVRREAWGEIYVSLEHGGREERNLIGVWRDRKAQKMDALDSALLDAFTKAHMSGGANRWWPWFQGLPPERGNWNAAPALVAMHLNRGEFVEYLAGLVLQAHRIAAPVIDQFVLKKK